MAYAGLPDLSGKLRSRIDELLDPNAATPDAAARSAAQNLASGQAAGSQFGANRGLILRDTELRDRFNQANTMLQPFLQRESSENIATQAQQGENQRLITQGQQAMERLQLEQQGAGDRLSAQLRAQLEQQANEGQQAMDRLKFSEGSATDRARMGIEAQLAERVAAENGMDARQAVQLENALKIAGLETDSRRQLQILQEAGLDSRQAAALAGQMSQQRLQGEQQLAQTRLQGQNQLAAGRQSGIAGIIQTLLSSGGKGASAGASSPPQRQMGVIPVDIRGNVDTSSSQYKDWINSGDQQTTGSRNSALIDQLLQYYGVTPGRDLSGYF